MILLPLFLLGNEVQVSIEKKTIPLDGLVHISLSLPEKGETHTMRRNLLYTRALEEPAFRLIDEKETREENGRYRVDYTLAPMKTGTHMLSFYEIPLLKQSVLITPFFITVNPIKGAKLPPPADQKLRLTPSLTPEMRLKVLSMTETQHYPPRHTLPLKHLISAAVVFCTIILIRLTRPSF